MKQVESDVDRQISIQSIHLSAFWNYFWKREGSFKMIGINMQNYSAFDIGFGYQFSLPAYLVYFNCCVVYLYISAAFTFQGFGSHLGP